MTTYNEFKLLFNETKPSNKCYYGEFYSRIVFGVELYFPVDQSISALGRYNQLKVAVHSFKEKIRNISTKINCKMVFSEEWDYGFKVACYYNYQDEPTLFSIIGNMKKYRHYQGHDIQCVGLGSYDFVRSQEHIDYINNENYEVLEDLYQGLYKYKLVFSNIGKKSRDSISEAMKKIGIDKCGDKTSSGMYYYLYNKVVLYTNEPENTMLLSLVLGLPKKYEGKVINV